MPEYHQMESYVELKSEFDLPILINKFESFLAKIGLVDEVIKHWIQSIVWAKSENGFVYSPPLPNFQIPLQHSKLTVRPLVMGFTSAVMPELINDWVNFELLFLSEEIDDYSDIPIIRYKKVQITKILEIMGAFTEVFPNLPVFLTDEAQDGEPWLGQLRNDPRKMCYFELGNLPSTIRGLENYTSDKFFIQKDNLRIWFARKQVFTKPPWN